MLTDGYLVIGVNERGQVYTVAHFADYGKALERAQYWSSIAGFSYNVFEVEGDALLYVYKGGVCVYDFLKVEVKA